MECTDKTMPAAETQTGASIPTIPNSNQVVISPTPGTIISIPENKCTDLVAFQPGTAPSQIIDNHYDTSPGQVINNTSGTDPVGDTQKSWQPPPWAQWPLEIRQMIWDACLYEDPDANNPRVIGITMGWKPGSQDCNGCPVCHQEWDDDARHAGFSSCPDDDKEGDQEDEKDVEDGEDEELYSIYCNYNHDNMFLVYDSSQVRRSEEAIASFHLVCKESRQRATRFSKLKGRAKENFHSTCLRQLRISPFDDIFRIDTDLVLEVLREWNQTVLEATLDFKMMKRFMLTFRAFFMLANPNEMLRYEDYLEYSVKCRGVLPLRSKSSVEYIPANAKDLFVLPAMLCNPESLNKWESFGAHDDIVEQKAAGLSQAEQAVMDDVQQDTLEESQLSSNVCGRKGEEKHTNDVLRVMWVTPNLVGTKQVQAQQTGPQEVEATQTETT